MGCFEAQSCTWPYLDAGPAAMQEKEDQICFRKFTPFIGQSVSPLRKGEGFNVAVELP